MKIAVFWLSILILSVAACSHGHCRHKKEDAPTAIVSPSEVGSGTDAGQKSDAIEQKVFVYKYDGSLQCGAGKAIALDVMAKELAGIPIYSSNKKQDGLMHIQVCGSNTGMANVYEISAKDLKKAESKGFKKWGFQ
ncbi:MAG: hypothetical protein AB7F86_00370 [Bdellovibrionales bacterium]